jgi:7,8-dihydropterin-6-yl-methyl-4-(beta-D-ribofuranosyl)aminobenzene 5'-phosphate synthase
MSGAYEDIDGPKWIAPGVRSTGEMGRLVKEQALVLEGKDGCALLTGCAHPGIVAVVERAREIAEGRPLLLIGGTHLFNKLSFRIKRTVSRLRELGVVRIAPCHCTGERGLRYFAEAYGDAFIPTGAGTVLEI